MPDISKKLAFPRGFSKFKFFICLFTILLQRFSSANNDRFRSLDLHVRYQSYIKGAPALAVTTVDDSFACMFFCLRKAECLSANLERNPNNYGKRLCTIFGVPLGIMGTELVPSDLHDFYEAVYLVPFSCSHAKFLGFHDSRNYTIDPDGANGNVQPFPVYCDMTSHGGIGVTVVNHDSMNRTLVSGCEPSGCYKRDVKYYGISDMDQLRTVTAVSSNCEQFIKYQCLGTGIFKVYDGISNSWLVSRDGEDMTYWGGALRNSGKCAKGACNCDLHDDGLWHEDSGLFTYKEDLPIITMRFGDVTPPEQGYHTLGSLKCYG